MAHNVGVAAQQTRKQDRTRAGKFKNLPAIAKTPGGQWNLQEELNFSDAAGSSNTSIDYGFPNGWDLGFSLVNVGLYSDPTTPLWDPSLLFNLEKSVQLHSRWHVVYGTQIGNAPWDPILSPRIEDFSYLDNQVSLPNDWGLAHAGAYYANGAMSGNGSAIGYLIGISLPVRKGAGELVADYVSGQNALSSLTLQLRWTLTPRLDIGLGVVLPAPGSSTPYTSLVGIYWH